MPIAREGWPFVATLAVLGAAALVFGFVVVFAILLFLALFTAFFFRDPERVAPLDPRLVISPADGRVVDVEFGCGAHSQTVIVAPLISASTETVVDELTLEVHPRPARVLPEPSAASAGDVGAGDVGAGTAWFSVCPGVGRCFVAGSGVDADCASAGGGSVLGGSGDAYGDGGLGRPGFCDWKGRTVGMMLGVSGSFAFGFG